MCEMRFMLIFSFLCIFNLNDSSNTFMGIKNDMSNTTVSTASRCVFGVYDYGVSTRDRVIIVDKHNEYRQLISENLVPNQPKGLDFMRMKYDSNLAILAQRTADKCHYTYETILQDEIPIGQNLFMMMSGSHEQKPNWTETLHSWFLQHDMYLYGGPILQNNRHYVQMVWSKTTRIGCGYVAFPLKRGHFMYYKYYVCNYFPGILQTEGSTPYEINLPMTKTP